MLKIHTVNLEEETYQTAILLLGADQRKFSELVRDFLTYFVSNCDRELTTTELRTLAKKFALEKRAALMQQQKITGTSEEEQKKIDAIREKRRSAIREAVRQEVNRIGNDRFRRYFLEDHYGDYQRIQDDTIAVISKSSGQPVELSDVITAYKEVRAS